MGGSGGGSTRWDSSIQAEKKAREKLEQARSKRNLFISFDYDDLQDVNAFRAQSKNDKSDIEFIDRSVRAAFDSQNSDYIRQKISERINQSSMTVVYLTENSATSRWVNWEIKRSLELGKKVVAFHSGKSSPKNLPSSVKDNKITVTSWSDLPKHLD